MDKGAHFFRCDLQVHTPRDINWTGADKINDDERLAYAAGLAHACRERGLQAIGITDHHDMTFVEYVRRAAAEETDEAGKPISKEQRLVVFPGMELTLGVPCQALLLFDADFPTDLFSLALTALAVTPSSPMAPKTVDVKRLGHIQSLQKLKEDLDKHTYLRDRYIIFPNVGENGDFSLLRKGLSVKYVEMPCVGGFVDGDINKVGQGNQNIIAGKAKEWGNRRIACFQTSDNRYEDHRVLGSFSTWIKWATPTAEALRQACLAQESRVSQTEPHLPSISVAAISVSNSAFLGPIDLELNPQYNVLIGGRGTGKSTILEYLRWALCDQPPGTSAEEDTPNYQARRSRLIEQTLKPFNATVQVRFELNGVPHLLRRNSQDGSLLIKIGNDDFNLERDGAERRPETPTLAAAGLTTGELDRIGRSLRPEDWLTLSLTRIKSVPVFEYRAREGEYIPFANASAGQQATALLKTLLNQVGPPLIIDQPEEDLDNPVMLEIVEQVWKAKQKRQLIFTSHNANLVVNGDAELVAWCDHRTAGDQSRGTIMGEGAIDIPQVRDAIKRIMEGGEAAFNLRKEKYGF